jgi:hypothetical protein
MPLSSISQTVSRLSSWFIALSAIAALWAVAPSTALAVPVLQIYVEGATYDSTTDTWALDTTGTDSGGTARVWVIGNVDGDGGRGAISDTTLIVSYDSQPGTPTIDLTSSTTGGLGGFTDPSVATDAVHLQTATDGSLPTFEDGDSLPPHGVFGPGRDWQTFGLGDLTLTDSPIGDIIDNFPVPGLDPEGAGQINVYEVSFSGYSGPFHFDVTGVTGEGTRRERTWAAPFSHDGEAHFTAPPNEVPELSGGATGASGLALLIGSALMLGAPRRKRS